MIPTTIRQLINAQQGVEANSFIIDGQKLYRVRLVAQIMGISNASAVVQLQLDDGTGRIDGRFWLPPDSDPGTIQNETKDWQEGVYVRIHGNLRRFPNSQKNTLIAISITPITDHNEITFHLLESIYVHLHNLRAAHQQPISHNPQGVQQQNPYSQDAYAHQMADDDNELPPLYSAVREVVQRCSSASVEGVSIDVVVSEMSAYGITEDQVREAIQYLSGEGHIWPTCDEEHYKSQ